MFKKKECCCQCTCCDEVVIRVPSGNREWMNEKPLCIDGRINKLMASRIINAVAKEAGIDLILSDLHYNNKC